MGEKKEKPAELRSRWNKICRYRYVAFGVLFFTIVDASLFAVYGNVNPLAWLYGAVFAGIISLAVIYVGSK